MTANNFDDECHTAQTAKDCTALWLAAAARAQRSFDLPPKVSAGGLSESVSICLSSRILL